MAATATSITLLAPMAIFTVILNLVLYLAVPVLLQVFLSTRQNKWLGLILPILGAVISLFLIAILALNAISGPGLRNVAVLGVFSLLPPAVLFLVYWLCRRHMARKIVRDEMTQMNIQDL